LLRLWSAMEAAENRIWSIPIREFPAKFGSAESSRLAHAEKMGTMLYTKAEREPSKPQKGFLEIRFESSKAGDSYFSKCCSIYGPQGSML
jgi:hypothetical protein